MYVVYLLAGKSKKDFENSSKFGIMQNKSHGNKNDWSLEPVFVHKLTSFLYYWIDKKFPHNKYQQYPKTLSFVNEEEIQNIKANFLNSN